MCFSPEVSLATFSIGIIFSILSWSLGKAYDKIVGGFLGFVSLMQGIEFLLWNHQKCDSTNKELSVTGMWLNHLQPIVLGALILWLSPRTEHKGWIWLVMGLYLLMIIPYSLQFQNKMDLQCTTKHEGDPHLIWNWNYMPTATFVYDMFLLAFISIALLGMPGKGGGVVFALVAYFTYTTSKFLYPRDYGSMWCFYTAFIPMIYYFARNMGYGS